MPIVYPQIIDANLNRVAEGLRVIEEYTRFIAQHKSHTDQLALLRKKLAKLNPKPVESLAIRDTQKDMRAKEIPSKRSDIQTLLKANFGRVKEGLRVLEEYTGNSAFNLMRFNVYELEKEIVLTLLKKPIRKGIYLISHDPEVLLKGSKMKEVALIQLRDKTATKSQILTKAQWLKDRLEEKSIPFIINDHLDIALAVNADGLHTGQDDLPIRQQRALLGPHKLIGRTTHTLAQGKKAQSQGADYVSVGPIWETPSKPGRKGIGNDYLISAKESLMIPYVAIGGIDAKTVQDIAKYQPPLIGLIRATKDIKKIYENVFY